MKEKKKKVGYKVASNERRLKILLNILLQQLIIKEGSYSYGMWSELPDDLEMYMRLYYFNVTNSEEIKNREPGTAGPKPILEEIGNLKKIIFGIYF